MKHPETYIVTESNGPRPAGPPDKCFYCGQPIGTEHDYSCVCRKRTVVVNVSFIALIVVPESWDADTINFCRNESSWCVSNLLTVDGLKDESCLCPCTKILFSHEASTKDEDGWEVKEMLGIQREEK